jgi:hypothetical protein
LEVSSHFLFYRFGPTKDVKKIPKTILKTRLKIKEATYTLVFGKYLVEDSCVLGRFIEDYLRNLTYWEN